MVGRPLGNGRETVGRPLLKVWILLTPRAEDRCGATFGQIGLGSFEQEGLFGLAAEVADDEDPEGVTDDEAAAGQIPQVGGDPLGGEVDVDGDLFIGDSVDPAGADVDVAEEIDGEEALVGRRPDQFFFRPKSFVERVIPHQSAA